LTELSSFDKFNKMFKNKKVFYILILVVFFGSSSLFAKDNYDKGSTDSTTFEEIQLQPEEISPEVIELEPNAVTFEEISPKEEVIEELPNDSNKFQVYVPQLQEISSDEFAQSQQKSIQFEEFTPKETVVEKPKMKEEVQYGEIEEVPITTTPHEVEAFENPVPTPQEVKPVVQIAQQSAPPPPPSAPPPPIAPLAPPPVPANNTIPQQIMPTQRPTVNLSVGKEYKDQLSDLAQKLAMLKERVLEAKTRIVSYGERLTKGFTSGTKVTFKGTNGLGDDFKIGKITVWFDGHQVYLNEFGNNEIVPKEISFYKGSILPGKHKVDISVVLNGDEGLFDFSYSAKLKLDASKFFNATEGKTVHINLKLIDKGGWFTAIEEKPLATFEITSEDSY